MITQVPVDPHIIDKVIPTTGLLAQLLAAKYANHIPLSRQEAIFGRAGSAIPRSPLAHWVGTCGVQVQPQVDALRTERRQHRVLHADETPVSMLKPGNGKIAPRLPLGLRHGRLREHQGGRLRLLGTALGSARRFLGDWRGSLTCEDFSGYKALIASGVTEVGCLEHSPRKFFDLHAANHSQIAEFPLPQSCGSTRSSVRSRSSALSSAKLFRKQHTQRVLDDFHWWMLLQRHKVPEGSASSKALDESLRRRMAMTLFVDDGQLPVDNNWIEKQILPIAIRRNNWLFAGSLREGQRAAAVMGLIQSAHMNWHDPYTYVRDVMARLPMQCASQIGELLPHRWKSV